MPPNVSAEGARHKTPASKRSGGKVDGAAAKSTSSTREKSLSTFSMARQSGAK